MATAIRCFTKPEVGDEETATSARRGALSALCRRNFGRHLQPVDNSSRFCSRLRSPTRLVEDALNCATKERGAFYAEIGLCEDSGVARLSPHNS